MAEIELAGFNHSPPAPVAPRIRLFDKRVTIYFFCELASCGSYFTRIPRLSFLAPDVVKTILRDRHPIELTVKKLASDTRPGTKHGTGVTVRPRPMAIPSDKTSPFVYLEQIVGGGRGIRTPDTAVNHITV